jgi:hypothetical protein
MKDACPEDVIFPIAAEVSDPWGGDYSSHTLYSAREIRSDFFLEIRNILNGYTDPYDHDCAADFLESFNYIKNPLSPYLSARRNRTMSRFDWLNLKEAKEIIKQWEGEPFDVLYCLARRGIIEKAVRIKMKRLTRK